MPLAGSREAPGYPVGICLSADIAKDMIQSSPSCE